MFKRTLFTVVAALGTLGFAASAHAAYLNLGTSNTSNATTTLTGNTAGAELLAKNTNGSSAGAFGLYGLRTATAPSATSAAVRGHNSSTNGKGYGVWGSQAGSGTGVYGFTPSGKGVWGSSTNGIGVSGTHTGTGANTAAGVQGQSAGSDGTAVKGVATNGGYAKGVWGVSGSGYGGFFEAPGSLGYGVYASGGEFGVRADSPSSTGTGVYGQHLSTTGTGAAVRGDSASADPGSSAVYGLMTATNQGGDSAAVRGQNNSTNTAGYGVWGSHDAGDGGTGVFGSSTGNGIGVYGYDTSGTGVFGQSNTKTAVSGFSASGVGVGGFSTGGEAGDFSGKVVINGALTVSGGCTGCAGAALKIDDPLDPAHKYLQHSSVTSSQQLGVYSGNVTTNANGFATVTMPRWFQALNRSFRYQLTSLSGLQQVAVAKEMHGNRFTVQSQRPHSKVSWQVTAVRHDRFAKAHPTRVIAAKPKADQGKYVNPELYGKPKTDGIGYQKPPRAPRTLTHKR